MSKDDISTYYDDTLVHYKQHWLLNKCHAVHVGLWYEDTKNLSEALINTNKKIDELLNPVAGSKILDAGCGVGGTAVYLAEKNSCHVLGITLSEGQLEMAKRVVNDKQLNELVEISLMDYENTSFDPESFDAAYGIESICYSDPKAKFINESYRLLKPGGKLVVMDFFRANREFNAAENKEIARWLNLWAIESLDSQEEFTKNLSDCGFTNIRFENLTTNILPSAKKLYRAYYLGWIPQQIYSLLSKKFGSIEKNHYKSAKYQYECLKKDLWTYQVVYAEKL